MKKSAFRLSMLILPIIGQWLLAWLLGVVTALSVIGLLMVSGWFITMAALSGLVLAGSHAFNYLAPSAFIRTFAISRTAARYGDLMVSHHAIFELLKQLRVRFFTGFSELQTHERATLGAAKAQHRLVSDIDTLSEFGLRFVSPWVVGVVVMAVFFGLLSFWFSAWLGLFFLVFVVVTGAFVLYVKPTITTQSQLHEQRTLGLLYSLPALTQLLLWRTWQGRAEAFLADDEAWVDSQKKAYQLRLLATFLGQLILLGLLVAVLMLGVDKLGTGTAFSVAWLLAVVFGVFGLMELLMGLTADIGVYAKAQLAKASINELFSTQSPPKTTPMPSNFTWRLSQLHAKQHGAVFGVADVNIDIRQGVPVVVTGVSGGGKSTLLSVLAGELLPRSGVMSLIDETGAECSPSSVDWQGQLGFLGQAVDIFDQSLRDNLRLGKQNASDDELFSVLSLVGLAEWVKSTPQGLDTPLGEYGMGVSGGQARRIALARLLLSPKKVLLLDEPFAGLDDGTRHAVWHALKEKQRDGILVVVSHHKDVIDETVDVLVITEPVPMAD